MEMESSYFIKMWTNVIVLVLFLLCTAKSTGDLKSKELSFLREPENTLLRDTTTWLHCQARADTQPLVRWLKDEQALSGGLSVLGNGSLVLRGYQADQGVYQCSITLPGTGTLLSRVAKVVYKGSPVFTREPASLIVYPGQTALFPCAVDVQSQVKLYRSFAAKKNIKNEVVG